MNEDLTQPSERSESWLEGPIPTISTEPDITRVLVCGDQPLYRSALASLIERDQRFRSAGETANDVVEVGRRLEQSDVQIVVIDFDVMPELSRSIEVLEQLLDRVAPRPTLVVSSGLDSDAYQRALRRGISGIVFKASGAEVLHAAIDSARRGQVWLDRAILPQMFDDSHTRRKSVCREKKRIDQLTPREREIVIVACTGITNKQIADKLSISETTVRHHLGSIFAKLGVSTRSELVVYGIRHKLATVDQPAAGES